MRRKKGLSDENPKNLNPNLSDSETITVTVNEVNRQPIADVGADQIANEGELVFLNGNNSFDPDNNPLTYQWIQTAGLTVSLSDPNSTSPSFSVPENLLGRTGFIHIHTIKWIDENIK